MVDAGRCRLRRCHSTGRHRQDAEEPAARTVRPAADGDDLNRGIVYAGFGFVCWGLYPLYFRQLAAFDAVEIMAQRVVWSLVFLLLVLAVRRQWRWLAETARQPRVLLAFTASAALLSINWVTYIWAVMHSHVVDASLGYFMTPLFNVALACTVLHERLRRTQWIALGLAAAGVLWLAVLAGHPPWVALALSSSFGLYGLLRKVATLGALEGLTLETLVLTPPAIAALLWLWGQNSATFPSPDLATDLWLIGVGPVTAVPLLLFAAGARRLPMTTLGMLQYLSPTLQLLLGVLLFHEPFSPMRLAGFGFIWAALLIYSVDGWQQRNRAAPTIAAG